jgi:uncharacterized membrane protein
MTRFSILHCENGISIFPQNFIINQFCWTTCTFYFEVVDITVRKLSDIQKNVSSNLWKLTFCAEYL